MFVGGETFEDKNKFTKGDERRKKVQCRGHLKCLEPEYSIWERKREQNSVLANSKPTKRLTSTPPSTHRPNFFFLKA